MTELFPVYEVGSDPKLPARVKAFGGRQIKDADIRQIRLLAQIAKIDASEAIEVFEKYSRERKELTPEERAVIIDTNAKLNLGLQYQAGLNFVYDGETRRTEMYDHQARRIEGFLPFPEMIRSRRWDSYWKHSCVGELRLKAGSVDELVREFKFADEHSSAPLHVPLDDPFMVANMSSNPYYMKKLAPQFENDPGQLKYEAKKALTLALAENVVRPQVEALVDAGAKWIQLDIPSATIDLMQIPILVEGINAVVDGIDGIKFSLHICYPVRAPGVPNKGYSLLFPDLLRLNPNVDHLSLELANNNRYEDDLAVFRKYADGRKFQIGAGVVDITSENQKGDIKPASVRDRILRAAKTLGDERLVYVAPDCGLRQVNYERVIKLYDSIVKGAELARRG